jgi:hypothetical protein
LWLMFRASVNPHFLKWLSKVSVTNGYDALLRRSVSWASGYGATPTLYTYDNASRLASAGDGANSAAYAYLANSPLVGQIRFAQSSTTRMTTVKQYDYLNRLTSIRNAPAWAGRTPFSFAYFYNTANQRANVALCLGCRITFTRVVGPTAPTYCASRARGDRATLKRQRPAPA